MSALLPVPADLEPRILRQVEADADELVAFTSELIRIPTENPPGRHYPECARLIGDRLVDAGCEVEYLDPPANFADELPEGLASEVRRAPPKTPRRNVLGRVGTGPRRLHLNGHFDVVPAGSGWTRDPYSGAVENGSVHGRGSSDMKGGLAAAIYAAIALRRAGVELNGALEISGTVDEESGGHAGVAWLAAAGHIAKDTDAVIIPEPFGSHRVSIGHRGVYWFRVTSRGEVAHGSMPFLGRNAVLPLGPLLEDIRTRWKATLGARRTALPVIPEGARFATINVNSIRGGQSGGGLESPQVPDRAELVVDRRFLPEEGLEKVRSETAAWVAECAARTPDADYRLEELLVVEPTQAPADSLAVAAVKFGARRALGTEVEEVASPGTYDQKHVARIAGVADCVAYGPGILELAHRPDEFCPVDELVGSAKVLALAAAAILGVS